jgi:hypothetical protein
VEEAGGGDLAQQADDDAPDAHQLITTGVAGPLAVGVSWQPSALVALAGVLVVALAGAWPLRAWVPVALTVRLAAPVLALVLAAAVLGSGRRGAGS